MAVAAVQAAGPCRLLQLPDELLEHTFALCQVPELRSLYAAHGRFRTPAAARLREPLTVALLGGRAAESEDGVLLFAEETRKVNGRAFYTHYKPGRGVAPSGLAMWYSHALEHAPAAWCVGYPFTSRSRIFVADDTGNLLKPSAACFWFALDDETGDYDWDDEMGCVAGEHLDEELLLTGEVS